MAIATNPARRRRPPERTDEGRRLGSAGSAVVVALGALLLGTLLNAPGIHKSAAIQPEGLRPSPADAQATYVVTRAHPGAIVDLHDAEGTAGAPARLVAALPEMIGGLRAAGYELTTVGELLDVEP